MGRAGLGRPTQFEFLILEGAQAGLSWSTILNKREGYRAAFAGFDPERIARFGKRDVARLMKNPSIVRNRLKIEAAISNARAFLEFQSSTAASRGTCGASSAASRSSIDFTQQKQVPATSPESDAFSKDLKKRGFRFVGSTIIYAHMQATGMVNDHLTSCFRYKECKALGKARRRRLADLFRRPATPLSIRRFPAAPARRAASASASRDLAVELPRRVRDHEPRAVQPER